MMEAHCASEMPETRADDADVSAPLDSIESLYAAQESALVAYAQRRVLRGAGCPILRGFCEGWVPAVECGR